MEKERNYEMMEKERILRRYRDYPLYDDTDLYYNGLIDSTECLDHKTSMSYKAAVYDTLMSRWVENKDSEKEAFKKPYFPIHVPKNKRSPNQKVVKTPNPITGVTVIHKNPSSNIDTQKQPELLLSPKQTPEKGFRFNVKFSGNIVFSVARSYDVTILPQDLPIKKRSRDEYGTDLIMTKKRRYNEDFRSLENNKVPAKLKARLQKDDAILVIEKNLTTTEVKDNSNRLAIPQNLPIKKRPLNTRECDFFKTKKRRSNEEEHRVENNIRDKLKARLQKEDAILVIKKTLTRTDVNSNNTRLAIPESQILNHNFLTEEEVLWLSERDGKAVRHLYVRLIDPSGEECDIKLAKWLMGVNVVYNLLSPWKQVVAKNKLRENTPIEVHMFRKEKKLYFAVIKV